jgi:hypothetical protein
LSVRLETLEDAMPHNNERYLTLQIRAMPRVLVLADDLKASAEFAHALRVLRHAVDHQHIDAKVNLAEYDAIFMVGVAAPDKRWQELAKYVADGRSVCVIPPGAGLQRSAYTSDAAKAVLPGVLQGRIDADAREWDLLDVAERGHPLLAPFRKWLADGVDYDFIDSPRSATSYWRFDAPQAHVAVTYAGTARHPAVLERPAQKGSGRVLLLTTPMDANAGAWNNYAEKRTTFYLALTLMCARRLVEAPADRNFNYTLGRQPLVITHAGEKHPKYLLRSGESSEEIRLDERGVWTGEQVQKAGNYAVVGIDPAEGGETVLHRFSLNIAGEESDLARVGFAALEAALGKGAIVAQDRHTSIVDSLSTHWDEPIELFPWLLIALLILLFLETWLANRFYRTPADAPAHKP